MTDVINPPHYTMKLEGVEKNILSYMNQQRKTNGPGSCEVVLLANNMKHYAHKIVLVSYSDFFRTYFGEGEKENDNTSHRDAAKKNTGQALSTVHLPGINSIELEPILEYMYTSTLELKAENINEILLVACLLQVTSVIEFCAEVMCKQPNWKSPLVSARITNFVRNGLLSRKDPAPVNPTAVTWATNGGKPAAHESRPRRRGRNLGGGWINGKHENKQTGTCRRRKDTHADHTTVRYNPTKSSGQSDYATLIRSGTRRNRREQPLYPPGYEHEKIPFDYPLTIDYDDLDRNMPLIEAGKMRSIFRTQEPNTLAGRPFACHGRRVHMNKTNASWGDISRSLSNKPQTTTYSTPNTIENVTVDNVRPQNVPQLIDCRNLWQVAQATALGMPVYPTGPSDFRLVKGSDFHQHVSATDSTEDDTPVSLTFRSHRSTRRRLNRNNHSDVDTNSLHGKDLRLLASQSTTKRDSLGELDTAQDSPINLSRPVFVPATSQKNGVDPKPKFGDREIPLTGRKDFNNSMYSSFSKPPTADHSSPMCLEGTKQCTDNRVDYHQRKRKLLLGALDQNTHESSTKSAKVCHPAKQHQCSSEDDILSREYSRNHRDSGSDLDSDDSGRPSSV